LACAYAAPQFDLAPGLTTTNTSHDTVSLAQISESPIGTRSVTGIAGTIAINASYDLGKRVWGGSTNYYYYPTLNLVQWNLTTITGLVSHPICLNDRFSATYYPSRHNFSELLLFEPAKEPGISNILIDDLRKENIQYLLIAVVLTRPPQYELGAIWVVGFDRSLKLLWSR
jgi:hypothetical protein